MIILLILVLFFVSALLIVFSFKQNLINHILYLLAGLLTLIAALGVAAGYINYSGSQIMPANIVSNTIYQNNNSSMLTIYITGNSISAWLGPNNTNLYYIATGNSMITVPQEFYYKINYTSANIIEVSKK